MSTDLHARRLAGLALASNLVLLVAGASALNAGTVTRANTFVNGAVADADQVNADFDALYTAVNDGQSDRHFLSASATTGVSSWSSTTWTPVSSIIGLGVDEAAGLTFDGDTITFPQAGHYFIHFDANTYGNNRYVGWRLRHTVGGSATLLQRTNYTGASSTPDQSPGSLTGIFEVGAGDEVQLQYAIKSGATAGWGSLNPLDGEDMVTSRLTVFRIR
jgi:hypothetical protein